jgi:protocatechuate 3,4-dioxygenase beta subunit
MHDDIHDRGLQHDLQALANLSRRRQLLGWAAGAGVLAVLGCDGSSSNGSGSGGAGGSGAGGSGGTGSGADGSCSTIPEETAGPYPGDGSNGPSVLGLEDVVRSDIRSSIGGATGVAEGVALTVTLTVVDASGCIPTAGFAVYLWHCDRDGNYSMYSQAVADENYLRGVQETDEDGKVTFTTIFPACYSGRWPHIHFEVYPSLGAATDSDNEIATSQLALPEDACDEVFATSGYEQSVQNLAQISLQSDNVFGDDTASAQLAEVSGSAATGFTATLMVAVNT